LYQALYSETVSTDGSFASGMAWKASITVLRKPAPPDIVVV